MTYDPNHLIDALADANRIRRSYNLPPATELIPGRRQRSEQCPLARTIAQGSSLGVQVFGEPYDVIVRRAPLAVPSKRFPLTPATRRFVRLFDAGAIPELIDHTIDPEPS